MFLPPIHTKTKNYLQPVSYWFTSMDTIASSFCPQIIDFHFPPHSAEESQKKHQFSSFLESPHKLFSYQWQVGYSTVVTTADA